MTAVIERKSIQEKAKLVADLKERIEKAPVVILLDFKRLMQTLSLLSEKL